MESDEQHRDLIKTARITGILYLILGISGMLGFLVFHPQIFISSDPAQTLANLTEQETFARIRILLELTLIVTQALAALWFYKLFKNIHPTAALATCIWGTVNSVIIMISAISMGVAVKIANNSEMTGDFQVAAINHLELFSSSSWGVGGLFFGLWLIPMGYAVVSSRRMPVWLGRILMIGGLGYILSTYVNIMGFTSELWGMLVIPATIGEFWMIGYLLIYGIRPKTNRENQ